MKHLLLGACYIPRLKSGLEALEIKPVGLPNNPCVDRRLAGHADLSVFLAKGEMAWLAPYLRGENIVEILKNYGYSVLFPSILQSAEYPNDAQFNLCLVGATLLFAKQISCQEIVDYLTIKYGYHPVSTRQGYARCAACVVDKNSLITADRGLAHTARKAGIEVLEIAPGYVELPGFSYGFLGGAAFLIRKDLLAFTGHLEQHPDRERIFEFLYMHDVSPVILSEEPVFDIGTAFLLSD